MFPVLVMRGPNTPPSLRDILALEKIPEDEIFVILDFTLLTTAAVLPFGEVIAGNSVPLEVEDISVLSLDIGCTRRFSSANHLL